MRLIFEEISSDLKVELRNLSSKHIFSNSFFFFFGMVPWIIFSDPTISGNTTLNLKSESFIYLTY